MNGKAHPVSPRPEGALRASAPSGRGETPNVKPGALRAALVPHIDYARGGATYAWGFKEVAERTDASLFVIVGTSHYSGERFTLTRQHFKTPLGVVPTDQKYIDRLKAKSTMTSVQEMSKRLLEIAEERYLPRKAD